MTKEARLQEVKEFVESGLLEGKDIVIYGDPDVDGLYAMYIASAWFNERGYLVKYHVNKNREHGYKLGDVLRNKFIVAVDFSISEEELQRLVGLGNRVLVLDHHEIKEDIRGDGYLVFNNQYADYPEEDRYLSGAGVVYEVLKYIKPNALPFGADGLVGVTLLSDVRELPQKARGYLEAMERMYGVYARQVILTVTGSLKNYGGKLRVFDTYFVEYQLAPYINALLRCGYLEEAVQFVYSGKSGKDARAEQKERVGALMSGAKEYSRGALKVLCVRGAEEDSTFLGLLCSKNVTDEQSVLGLYYTKEGQFYRGSVRGRKSGVDYLSYFRSKGVSAAGHDVAFGVIEEIGVDEIEGIESELGEYEVRNEVESDRVVYEVENLRDFLESEGLQEAKENNYRVGGNRSLVRYVGSAVDIIRCIPRKKLAGVGEEADCVGKDGKGYLYERDSKGDILYSVVEWEVDGVRVKGFYECAYPMSVKENLIQLWWRDKELELIVTQ